MYDLPALAAALTELVNRAGDLAIQLRTSMSAELKPDGSIVTNADVAVEEFLRRELPALLPHANVWGEELGYETEGEQGVWLVDPIDGTSNYRYGLPYWGVSIGWMQNGVSRLGAIALPDLKETYIAYENGGATRNGIALPAIKPGPIEPFELMSCGDWVTRSGVRPVGKIRCTGAFVIDGAFVASQRHRAAILGGERLYDASAAIVINRELGADIRMLDGTPFVETDYLENKKIDRPWVMFPRDAD